VIIALRFSGRRLESTGARSVCRQCAGALHVATPAAESGAKCVYSAPIMFRRGKDSPYIESDVLADQRIWRVEARGRAFGWQARGLVNRPGWRVNSARTGARGKGGNFIETFLAKAARRAAEGCRRYPHFADLRLGCVGGESPTDRADATGIIHAANSGACTWYEFAKRLGNCQ